MAHKHILIAPNTFKNSLDAEAVALAIQKGFMQSRLDCTCTCFPVGDGGDGTAGLIMRTCPGSMVNSMVHDPLGRMIHTSFGLIDNDTTAVIEMADASGLRLLRAEELNPLLATSAGTGEQMKVALDRGVRRIIVGMGGSATVDGGTGILQALGIRFLDADGAGISGLPGNLGHLARVDLSGLDPRILQTEVIVLCDVDNQLLGEKGAAAMFGPQKGASLNDVWQLDAALGRLAAVAQQQTGKDITTIQYGGTAGGAAAGVYAFLSAKLVNGIEYFLQLTGFGALLEKADLVVTGEGSIDEQTLQGKGPFGVARLAKERGKPVIGLAGKVPVTNNTALDQYFDALVPIGHQALDLPAALAATEANLIRTATMIGNMLAV